MRWRTGYLWALGTFVAVALLVGEGRPNAAAGCNDGAVYTPSAPSASVESAPSGQLLLTHFDWCDRALRSADLSLVLRAIRASAGARQAADAAQPHYGPLHRRPPPSFS